MLEWSIRVNIANSNYCFAFEYALDSIAYFLRIRNNLRAYVYVNPNNRCDSKLKYEIVS
jgi:hypothetical protein